MTDKERVFWNEQLRGINDTCEACNVAAPAAYHAYCCGWVFALEWIDEQYCFRVVGVVRKGKGRCPFPMGFEVSGL